MIAVLTGECRDTSGEKKRRSQQDSNTDRVRVGRFRTNRDVQEHIYWNYKKKKNHEDDDYSHKKIDALPGIVDCFAVCLQF